MTDYARPRSMEPLACRGDWSRWVVNGWRQFRSKQGANQETA
jgi:hypothetical protein